MRAARAFRQRDKVLKFEGAFHGTSDYALMSVSPSAALEFPQAEASSGGIPKVIEDLILSAPFNDLDTTSAIIEAHHTELAAVIVEPLQRIIAPRPGFLEGLREITARYGIILIFDEVVTGFRLAYGGAQEYYGVTPDLCAVGKIVGGGYPLGAIMGREDVMQVFNQDEILEGRHVPQIGTMNGSPVACAAGLATLTELRKEGTYPRLRDVGRRVRQGLADICAANGIMAQHCGEDVVFDVCFTDQPVMNYRDSLAADSRKMARFNFGLLEHGILKGQQKFYPSLAHTDEDINKTLEVFSAIIPQLRSL
jgi:glutamate-1-semialdehyde 2,1-aminomutase